MNIKKSYFLLACLILLSPSSPARSAETNLSGKSVEEVGKQILRKTYSLNDPVLSEARTIYTLWKNKGLKFEKNMLKSLGTSPEEDEDGVYAKLRHMLESVFVILSDGSYNLLNFATDLARGVGEGKIPGWSPEETEEIESMYKSLIDSLKSISKKDAFSSISRSKDSMRFTALKLPEHLTKEEVLGENLEMLEIKDTYNFWKEHGYDDMAALVYGLAAMDQAIESVKMYQKIKEQLEKDGKFLNRFFKQKVIGLGEKIKATLGLSPKDGEKQLTAQDIAEELKKNLMRATGTYEEQYEENDLNDQEESQLIEDKIDDPKKSAMEIALNNLLDDSKSSVIEDEKDKNSLEKGEGLPLDGEIGVSGASRIMDEKDEVRDGSEIKQDINLDDYAGKEKNNYPSFSDSEDEGSNESVNERKKEISQLINTYGLPKGDEHSGPESIREDNESGPSMANHSHVYGAKGESIKNNRLSSVIEEADSDEEYSATNDLDSRKDDSASDLDDRKEGSASDLDDLEEGSASEPGDRKEGKSILEKLGNLLRWKNSQK